MTPQEIERRRQLLKEQYQPMFSMPSFSMPNIMNMFGSGNQTTDAPAQIRPEVLEMVKRQQNANAPGMFFGWGPKFSTEAYNQANNIQTGVVNGQRDPLQQAISSIYNLTGDNAGTIKAPVTEPGFMDKLGSLSEDEIMGGLQGMKGLLDVIYPEQPALTPYVAKATPGLSLSVNPYEDLYKRYGLLGR